MNLWSRVCISGYLQSDVDDHISSIKTKGHYQKDDQRRRLDKNREPARQSWHTTLIPTLTLRGSDLFGFQDGLGYAKKLSQNTKMKQHNTNKQKVAIKNDWGDRFH